PAAAGMISSLTMLMLWLASPADGSGASVAPALGNIKYALPALMVLLAFMMFSQLKYPSFKNFNWRTQRTVPALLILVLLAVCTVRFYHWMPAVLFTVYFLYGLVRPWISKRWRREIEDSQYDPESSEESAKVHPLPSLEEKKQKKS
ncbi:MAG: CDP-diacylglycerol--serine O-phosphatidyltransferase, partial [Verrucomicrobiota bacterium]